MTVKESGLWPVTSSVRCQRVAGGDDDVGLLAALPVIISGNLAEKFRILDQKPGKEGGSELSSSKPEYPPSQVECEVPIRLPRMMSCSEYKLFILLHTTTWTPIAPHALHAQY